MKVEFVSGGPKNYAYITNRGDQTCKVRGFTLKYNSPVINFETVKDLVTRSPDKCDPYCFESNMPKTSQDEGVRLVAGLKHEFKTYICTEQGINDIYELIMKEMSLIVITNPEICRDKLTRKLFNWNEEKVYTKIRRLDNHDTVPYGY